MKSLQSLLMTNNYSVMYQVGTSAFNTVMCWHELGEELGEVESECTSHNFSLFAVCAKNFNS